MFVMVAGRRQGKTMTAIRWLLERPGPGRVLIVANEDRKRHLLHEVLKFLPAAAHHNNAPQEFVKQRIAPNIITADRYDWFMRGTPSRGCEIGIDDAEEVLNAMFRGRVEFAAFNATLIPVVGSSTIRGEYVDGEQGSIEGHRAITYIPAGSDRFA